MHCWTVAGLDLKRLLVGVDRPVGTTQLVAKDVAHLDVEVGLLLRLGGELDVALQHRHQVLPAALRHPQPFQGLDGLEVGGVEGEDSIHAGVGIGCVLVGVLPDGGGAEENADLLAVVLGQLELSLIDGEQVRGPVEAGVEAFQRIHRLAVLRVELQRGAVRLDGSLLVAEVALLHLGHFHLDAGPLLERGRQVARPGQGGGQVPPHVLLAVELGQLGEGLGVRLEVQRPHQRARTLVDVVQPLDIGTGDFSKNLLPRLDGGRRFQLLLQRDDVFPVLAAAGEGVGQRVQCLGVGGVELEDFSQRSLGRAGIIEVLVLDSGQHQVEPGRQRSTGQLVRDLLVDGRQLLVGASLLGQPLHILPERVVGGVELQRAAEREEGTVLLPQLLLAHLP